MAVGEAVARQPHDRHVIAAAKEFFAQSCALGRAVGEAVEEDDRVRAGLACHIGQLVVADDLDRRCERIATNLAAVRELNPRTTRWIQHDPPHDDLSQIFEELQFTWDSDNAAHDPQWQPIDDEQAETLTGASLDDLERRLGDIGPRIKEESNNVPNESYEAQGTA